MLGRAGSLLLAVLLLTSAGWAQESSGKEGLRGLIVQGLEALYYKADLAAASGHFGRALQLAPEDYEANLFQGMAYLAFGKSSGAKDALPFLERALAKQRTAFNVRLMALAVEKVDGMSKAGVLYTESARRFTEDGSSDVQLQGPDLRWGTLQLKKMLKDRPEMAPYAPEGSWLWRFAVGKFAGEGLRTRIWWDPRDPDLDTDAITADAVTWEGVLGLRIRKEPRAVRKNGNAYWSSFIFEALNDDWRERATWIWMRVKGRAASKAAHHLANRVAEAETVRKSNRFYFEKWVPYCKSMGLGQDPEPWSMCEGSSPFPEDYVFSYFEGVDRVYDKQYERSIKGPKP